MRTKIVILAFFTILFSYDSYISFYGSGEKLSKLNPSNISLGWSKLFDSNSKYELEDDTPLLGGWEDCVFTIYQSFSGRMEWEQDWSDNNDFPSWINLPDWHNYSGNDGWYYLNSESGTSEHDSIIYFTKYFVIPVE